MSLFGRIRPSGGVIRLIFLAALCALLYFIAGTSGSGWLYVVAAGIGGVVAVSVVGPLWSVRGLSATRRAPESGTAGEPLEVGISLYNSGRLRRFLIEARDGFAGDEGSVSVVRISAGETVEIACRLENPRRGVYRTGEISVESTAPFGLIPGRRRLRCDSQTVIHPRTFDVARLPLSASENGDGDDTETSPHRGLGGDFWGVREYRPGDPTRLIAWRRSARSLASDRLSVVELAHHDAPPVKVSLDLDAQAPPEALEAVISAAASILLQALREGRALYADAGPQNQPFPENPDDTDILDWCAALETGDPPQDDASVLVAPSVRRVAERGSQVRITVLVSCHALSSSGAWMTPDEERMFLDSVVAGGGIAVRVGAEFPEPLVLA